MRTRVFISYAREDAQTAKRLFFDLRRRGYDPWMDTQSLVPGQDFKRTIKQAIKESTFVLILISSKSVNKRGFFQAEVKEAIAVFEEIPPGDVFLVPVRLDSSIPRHEQLERIHWVDLFPSYEEGFPKLAAALKAQGSDIGAGGSTARPLVGGQPFGRGEIRRLLFSGNYDKAVEAYNELIDQNPKMYSLFVGRANALYLVGRRDDALRDLAEAERLEPGNPMVDAARQKILKGEVLPGQRARYEDSIRRGAINRGNNALVRLDLEAARHHYDEAKAQGLNDATYGICLSMIGILKSEPQSAREALASFDHATAGPFMSVEIQAVKAFIALLEGQTPDLSELQAARRPLEQFDIYRTALGHLRAALATANRTSPETERIFEAMRYQQG
jgi:tetratricopeptide (TPR) repeat protein